MEEKEKRISYRAPLSRWRALTDLAASKESSIQQLIDESLDSAYFRPENSNPAYVPSTNDLEPVLPPQDPKERYSNPDLAVLQDATAKALEEQDSSELAKAIISLLRIYGSKDARFWAVSSSGEAQQPKGSGSQGNEPSGRIASVPEAGIAEGRSLGTHKKKIG